MTKLTTLTIMIPKELKERLQKEADESFRSLSRHISFLLNKYEKIEDEEDGSK